MVENVFLNMHSEGLITNIRVEENLPSKGKPLQKETGSTSIWVVKFLFNNQDTLLESSRGGPREWASLDNLNKWFRTHEIFKYLVNMSPEPVSLLQQNLALTTENPGQK
jgi:hypothetical protein